MSTENAGAMQEVSVCRFDELSDPDSREFNYNEGSGRGFIVRKGKSVFAYQNYCMHVGHALNWKPNKFLTRDGKHIICAAHGAIYEIDNGLCIGGPCPGKKLRPLELEVRDGVVVVQVVAPG